MSAAAFVSGRDRAVGALRALDTDALRLASACSIDATLRTGPQAPHLHAALLAAAEAGPAVLAGFVAVLTDLLGTDPNRPLLACIARLSPAELGFKEQGDTHAGA